ncbi:sensor histidine kinase [Geobacillus thermoleovorans]|uniref:cache domain-containing sensor histidine kinase n=1 Tax=Geobacillus TaxID=129337 RepID=UPI001EF1282E|nr:MULTISPECIES: sensor histidine kinase [Geobacillus]MCG6794022.1 sensor histidine kinase [Geobacillus sp. YHL]UPT59441.1 sensor histidine kinase [Geobacillus thermoleovorans]
MKTIRSIWSKIRLKDNIRSKYFLLMIGISIPPLLLLGFVSFHIARSTLIDHQLKTMEKQLQTSSHVADLLFQNIINMERLISWNGDVRNELVNSEKYVRGGLDQDTTRKIEHLISSYFIDTQYIDSICLFDNHYRAVCYGNPNSSGKYGKGGVHQEIARFPWYQRSLEEQGRPVFFGYNVLNEGQSNSTFSSVKLLRDPQNVFHPRKIGLLVVNIRKSMFQRVFPQEKSFEWAILDFTGKEGKDVFNKVPPLLLKFLNSDAKSFPHQLQEKGYLISSYQNETTEWFFIQIIKEKELLKQARQIGVATALISSVLGLFALFFAFFASGRVAKPLMNLREIFQKVTVENQELNEKLVRAQLEKKEAELRALQAQIKPHFLYNTLDSIYWMAILKNHHEIAQMAVALSESFKLSLNQGEDMIPVSKELEHIRHYVTIQNIRYQNRFRYIEQVDCAVIEKKIPKLLLQPLVENAIYHGLEPKVGPGTVEVIGSIVDGQVVFVIRDNGVGIADMKQIEQGFGLRNVRERLVLCYGPESSLTVSSQVNEGTTVEIKFRPEAGGDDKC